MNISNIAIVRATNIIPFDGIVKPVSEVSYLKKYSGQDFEFSNRIRDMLDKQGLLPKIDFTKISEDYLKEIAIERAQVIEQYLPYLSDYNPVVLWTLNGIVPDDNENGFGNNIFSNKTCAIIDGLADQIENSNVVSLVPTDTAIKGKIKLSKQATILIKKERYENLSQKEKDKLNDLGLRIKVFEGDLKEIINETLQEEGYTPETLSLRRTDKGYIHSDTSDELIETISNIANEKNIPQELYWDFYRKSESLDKLDTIEHKTRMVNNFYKKAFFEYLFSEMDIQNEVKEIVMFDMGNPEYMKELCDEIERIGFDEYKKVVDTYNAALEQLKINGDLPTPQQIVDSIREKKDLNLNSLIKETIEQQKNPQITMEGLVRNALGEQDICGEDVRKVDKTEIIIEENTKEGVSLDD